MIKEIQYIVRNFSPYCGCVNGITELGLINHRPRQKMEKKKKERKIEKTAGWSPNALRVYEANHKSRPALGET